MKHLEGKHMTRIVFTTMALCVSSQALAQTHQVSTTQELRDAVSQANPGDRILLADGTYRLDDRLRIDRPGTLAEPIVIEAVNMHQARIEVNTIEGIVWSAAHWQMEGLHFKGVCSSGAAADPSPRNLGQSAPVSRSVGRQFKNNTQSRNEANMKPIGRTDRRSD